MRCLLGAGVALGLASGCGASLAELPLKDPQEALEQLRRGGLAWDCHARDSEVFRVYLVCPGRDLTLGVMERADGLAFACPDRSPKQCEKVAREMLRQGADTRGELAP